MVDAESKVKKGRIRHCYPRKEIYHRWIHSPEYVYAANGCIISGKYNYLSYRNIGKLIKDEDIKENWNYHKHSIIAVINRDKKKICISVKYAKWYTELLDALPDYYEIFLCSEEIPTPNILSFTAEDKEILCKEHLKCIIQRYTELTLRPFYNTLKGALTLNSDVDKFNINFNYIGFKYVTYGSIKEFVKKYNIKSYSWYKESLNSKFNFQNYWPSNFDKITIEIPSIKKILTNTIFTENQKDYFRKRYFYTKYCYGRGISFKDVEFYWNKEVLSQEMYVYFNKHNIYWLHDYRTESCITWNNYVIRSYEIEEKHIANRIKENITKSVNNLNEAEEKAKNCYNTKDAITAWRNGTNIQQCKIEYKAFIPPRTKRQYGTWKTRYIHSNSLHFNNTQLKLVGQNVITSRNAKVSLSSAITAFQLFNKCIEVSKNTGRLIFKFSNNVKVDIYNLRDIQYIEKYTDAGVKLGYNTWLIRIGCHNLWIDDVMEFIKYYNLEDKFYFNIDSNNKNN